MKKYVFLVLTVFLLSNYPMSFAAPSVITVPLQKVTTISKSILTPKPTSTPIPKPIQRSFTLTVKYPTNSSSFAFMDDCTIKDPTCYYVIGGQTKSFKFAQSGVINAGLSKFYITFNYTPNAGTRYDRHCTITASNTDTKITSISATATFKDNLIDCKTLDIIIQDNIPLPTNTPIPTSTPTSTPIPTSTPTNAPTNTPIPSGNSFTRVLNFEAPIKGVDIETTVDTNNSFPVFNVCPYNVSVKCYVAVNNTNYNFEFEAPDIPSTTGDYITFTVGGDADKIGGVDFHVWFWGNFKYQVYYAGIRTDVKIVALSETVTTSVADLAIKNVEIRATSQSKCLLSTFNKNLYLESDRDNLTQLLYKKLDILTFEQLLKVAEYMYSF